MQNDSNSANSHNQSLRSHGIILAQMISQTMWRLSESIIIEWDPRYFNKSINEVLDSINNSKFQDAKGISFVLYYFSIDKKYLKTRNYIYRILNFQRS